MSEGIDTFTAAGLDSADQAAATIGRLFDVARPEAVFSKPVTEKNFTIITASEVNVGMGLGFGAGEGKDSDGEFGGGGGGGGGGASAGRPVAAIIIGDDGVRIEPIIDPTKIAIAFFTTIGAMFMAWRAMRRSPN